MFLSGVLFVLFLAGCWLYCLTDAALTPTSAFPGLRKQVWIAIISVTFILGAVAWVIARYRSRSTRAVDSFLASEARARHPASRSRLADPSFRALPVGPDDDPEFLLSLDRFISGPSDSGELSCQHFVSSKALGVIATLGQVDYGVELVSTNGVPATFTFSNFSVNAN
jgi:hypothetical protein